MPGGFTRFGPAKEKGLARSAQTGSTSRLLPARLDQIGRVPDVDDAHALAVEARRRPVLRKGAREALRPGLAAVAQLPLEEGARPLRPHPAGIEEAHAIEMVGRRALVVGVGAAAGQKGPAAGTDGRHRAEHLQHAPAATASPVSAACGRTIGIASGHAFAHVLLDSVLRKGISKAVFCQSLHSRYRFGHILRRQGHEHLIVKHAAVAPLGEARDGQGGLARGKRATPAVGAGAFSHDAPIELLVARPLQSIDEVHHGARRPIEERDVGRIEPAGGERRHGQRLVSTVLDAVHCGLVSACVLER